jgi:aspartate/methionine/tyrosine aminotransferase
LESIGRKQNGDGEVIILAPFFGPYVGIIKLANLVPVEVDTDPDFNPNMKKIEDSITKNTKAIMVNSPNNPSGRVYTYDQYK